MNCKWNRLLFCLLAEIKDLCPEVYVIADASQAGHANKATEEAVEVAFHL